MSLTKNPKCKKKFFIANYKIAESFEGLDSSLVLLAPTLCPCQATCKQAVFTQTAWINQAANMLNCTHNFLKVYLTFNFKHIVLPISWNLTSIYGSRAVVLNLFLPRYSQVIVLCFKHP